MRYRMHKTHDLPPAGDSEFVYYRLLELMTPHVELRVMTDIIAGASAGGINGILLAQAISQGSDLEPLRDLWVDAADSDRLLEPAGGEARF